MVTRSFDWLINTHLLLFGLVFFVLLCLLNEFGFQLGGWSRRRRPHHERELSGVGAITAGMLGLLAFNLGVSINMAQDRYDARRGLVVQEANAIGTVWLRAKLVSGDEGPALLSLIEEYARVRLAYTTADEKASEAGLIARTGALQTEMWARAQAGCARTPTPGTATPPNTLNHHVAPSVAQSFTLEGRGPGKPPRKPAAGSAAARPSHRR